MHPRAKVSTSFASRWSCRATASVPLTAASFLGLRSSDAWPEWEVPLGFLTPHGAMAIRQMRAYMRLNLARKELFPATGCPSGNEIYLYADTPRLQGVPVMDITASFSRVRRQLR